MVHDDGCGTRILLARHAETAAPDRFHGAESDIALSDQGREQATLLGRRLAAIALAPSAAVAFAYLGTYYFLRAALMWTIGIHGLKQRGIWPLMPLLPLWDMLAFAIWLLSFPRRSIRWRGADYYIREGKLVPVVLESEAETTRL